MADGRMLNKRAGWDARIAQLSGDAKAVFFVTFSAADVEGRIIGHPEHIRTQVVPAWGHSDAEIEQFIAQWTGTTENGRRRPLVAWYAAPGSDLTVIQFLGWPKNQREGYGIRRKREAPSKLPPPPEQVLEHSSTTPALLQHLAVSETRADVHAGSRASMGRSLEIVNGEERMPLEGVQGNLCAADAAAVREIYGHWRQVCGKTNARYDSISPARRDKIAKRLTEFSADELKRAIDGVALDPWDERPRHNDLTIVFRSREQVERFLGFAENPPRRNGAVTAEDILAQAEESARAGR